MGVSESKERINTESEKAFFQAALDGDINKLSELLSQEDPVDPNCILRDTSVLKEQLFEETLKILDLFEGNWAAWHWHQFKPTALFLAVCQRHPAVVGYLLSQGAAFSQDMDEDEVDCRMSEIAVATLHNDTDTIRVILDNDWTQVFQLTEKRLTKMNIVALAAKNSSPQTLKTIISCIPDQEREFVLQKVEDKYKGSALAYALKHKRIENAEILLKNGLKIDKRSLFKSVESIEAFRFVEANIACWQENLSWLATDEDGNSLLHLSLKKLDYKSTTDADIADMGVIAGDLIQKYGLDVNASGFLGESVLHLAAPRSGPLTELLCQNGARLTPDDDGQDPVESMLMDWDLSIPERQSHSLEIIKIFGKYQLISEFNQNSLCIAAHLGLNDMLEYLLSCHAENKNLHANAISTTSGLSILQVAASSGKKDAVDILLAQGADPHYLNFNGDNILNTCAIAGQFDLLAFFRESFAVQEVFNKQGKTVKDFLHVSIVNTKNSVDFKVLASFSQVTGTQLEEMMKAIQKNISLLDAQSLSNILRTVTEVIAFKNYSIMPDAISELRSLILLMNRDPKRSDLLTLLEHNLENIIENIVLPMVNSGHKRYFYGFILFSTLMECRRDHDGMQRAIKPYLEKDFIYALEEKYNEAITKLSVEWDYYMYSFLKQTRVLYQYFSSETHQKWYQFFMSEDVEFSYDDRDHARALEGICFSLSSEETLALVNHTIEKTRAYPEYKYQYYAIFYLHALSNHPMSLALCKNYLSAFSANKIFTIGFRDDEICTRFIQQFPENERMQLYEIFYKNITNIRKSEKNSDYFRDYKYLFEIFMYIDKQGILFNTLREDMTTMLSHNRGNIGLWLDCGDLLLNNIVHYFSYPQQCQDLLQEVLNENSRFCNAFERELIYQYSHGALNIKSPQSKIQEEVFKDLKSINIARMGTRDALVAIYLIVHNDIQFSDEERNLVLNTLREKGENILEQHQVLELKKGPQDLPQSIYLLAFLVRFVQANPLEQRELIEQLDFHAWWRANQFTDIDGDCLKQTEANILAILKTACSPKPAATNRSLLMAYQAESSISFGLNQNGARYEGDPEKEERKTYTV